MQSALVHRGLRGVARPVADRRAVGPSHGLVAPISRSQVAVRAAAFAPPTVAETKQKFIQTYSKPIPAVYSTVMQELLVQHHFVRYGINYEYNEVFALGFVNVFEQVMESIPADERAKIFNAYINALAESPEKYRQDAAKLESLASSLSGPEQLQPGSESELQKALGKIAERSEAGKFSYNKFIAIGLFRLLELTGAKEPSALERLVKAVKVRPELVNRDLMTYKGILSKLSAAKELMKEMMDREKKKQAEREAEKAARKAAEAETQTANA